MDLEGFSHQNPSRKFDLHFVHRHFIVVVFAVIDQFKCISKARYSLVAMIRGKYGENEIFSRSGKGREFCVRNDRKSVNLKFREYSLRFFNPCTRYLSPFSYGVSLNGKNLLSKGDKVFSVRVDFNFQMTLC